MYTIGSTGQSSWTIVGVTRFDGAVTPTAALGTALVGLGVGFLSGLFGKGGSAIATPLLHALGVPAMAAVASPLPATFPATLAAANSYRRERLIERAIVVPSIAVGVPATVAGAFATRWIDGAALVRATDVILIALGVRLAFAPDETRSEAHGVVAARGRVLAVGATVGLVSGLLANSGGFLLAPLYVSVLRVPIKRAFGASLVVSAVLAVPATIVHAALGHVDWAITTVFAFGSVPLAFLGGRLAVRTTARRLHHAYGLLIVTTGAVLLVV